jgi:hypothetical protein
MKSVPQCRVVRVEKLGGGILIQFDTGEAALYSAALLHSMLNQAFVLPIATPEPPATTETEPESIRKPN